MNRRQALFAPRMLATLSGGVSAQAYPGRPIKLIVPYPPGGNTDIVARLFAQKLSERLAQPVVIDNRGGAAGAIGAAAASKSPADGYTLVIGDLGSMVIGGVANPNLPYAPLKDFAPISLVTSVSIVVCVNPKSPVQDVGELLKLARAQPGRLSIGTGGIGGPGHLALELLTSMTGTQFLHVPFKGGAQATIALLGGEIDVMIDGSAFSQVKSGKLRAIAVTGPRLPALPDVPGIGETVKGFSFTNWWGMLAPVGTPPEAVRRLNDEFTAIAALPDVKERLTSLGLAAQSSTPQQFGEHLRTETEKVAGVVKSAGIKFE
jgi:tripartite-type tricarboxylate transporter receptor subunit TctC